MGVVRQRHHRALVAGELRHERDFDSLRLQRRDERVARAVRLHRQQADPLQRRDPADLASRSQREFGVKLIILGNGRVGESQICRRLRGKIMTQASLPHTGLSFRRRTVPMCQRRWREAEHLGFRGQDIYLGTRTLFMESNAVFLGIHD